MMTTIRDEVAGMYAKYYHMSATRSDYIRACEKNMFNFVLHDALLAWEAIDQYKGTYDEN